MAPFPEDEIMTIKRLEVALRKSDFKLLKEGAYKLHEKYHAHHHFEYLDLLKEILDEVQGNYAIPPDVKDILIPTIQDILSPSNNDQDELQNRVSSLTSLSYGINAQQEQANEEITDNEVVKNEFETNNYSEDKEQIEHKEEYIKPFQEFTSIKPIGMTLNTSQEDEYTINEPVEDNQDSKIIVDSYNGQQTEDFDTDTPIIQQQNIFATKEQSDKYPQEYLSYKTQEEYTQEVQEETETEENTQFVQDDKEEKLYEDEYQEPVKEVFQEPVQEYEKEASIEEEIEEVNEFEEEYKQEEHLKQKSIAIFFGQNSSVEKIKNISRYHELIYNQDNFSINEMISLINEIKAQADTNVSELQTFLEQLKSTDHNINMITNSQSSNLIDLLNQNDITYSIFNPSKDKRLNLLPLFGLTNLYKCIECDSEYLENNEKINSFILQCPKCKKAMLPNLYTSKGEINMDYYNSAIIALANSDTWLLIHPSLTEKLTLNMIRSAMKISSKVEEVYILDKDINVRETYKKLFEDINPLIKVSNDLNTMESFLNNI